MMTIEATLAILESHLKANPTEATLEAWRDLRGYIAALNDQRWIYFMLGLACGIALFIVAMVIGGTHP